MTIKNGRHDSGIRDRANMGREAISLMTGILWDKRYEKTEQNIYNAVMKKLFIGIMRL
jgi:hypothetical protein